jgi:two-component system chemotaxis response regulator CheY
LIVDDSRVARALVDRIVRQVGFETTQAEHGKAALEVVATDGPFDLALVDWNMPVMDGLEFVKALRQDRRQADTKVLMVTSESSPNKIARALMVGADEYLVKPFDEAMLHSKLQLIGALEGV